MTDKQRQRIEDNAKDVEKKILNKMKELLKGRKEQEIRVPPSFDDHPEEWYNFVLQPFKVIHIGSSKMTREKRFTEYTQTTSSVIVECPCCKQLFYQKRVNSLGSTRETPRYCPRCMFPVLAMFN